MDDDKHYHESTVPSKGYSKTTQIGILIRRNIMFFVQAVHRRPADAGRLLPWDRAVDDHQPQKDGERVRLGIRPGRHFGHVPVVRRHVPLVSDPRSSSSFARRFRLLLLILAALKLRIVDASLARVLDPKASRGRQITCRQLGKQLKGAVAFWRSSAKLVCYIEVQVQVLRGRSMRWLLKH